MDDSLPGSSSVCGVFRQVGCHFLLQRTILGQLYKTPRVTRCKLKNPKWPSLLNLLFIVGQVISVKVLHKLNVCFKKIPQSLTQWSELLLVGSKWKTSLFTEIFCTARNTDLIFLSQKLSPCAFFLLQDFIKSVFHGLFYFHLFFPMDCRIFESRVYSLVPTTHTAPAGSLTVISI